MSGQTDLTELRLAVRQASKVLKGIDTQLQALQTCLDDIEHQAFLAGATVAELFHAIESLSALPEQLAQIRRIGEHARQAAGASRTKAFATLPQDLRRRLSPHGFAVEGSFPRLQIGLFTVVFQIEAARPEVQIQFGPGVAILRRVSPAAEEVATGVVECQSELDKALTPPEVFLPLLWQAYQRACRQKGQPFGWSVPLTTLLLEVSVLSQASTFYTDPVREKYRSYGRVRFAYDLFQALKAGHDRHDGQQLQLMPATLEQTRHPADHLWVPTQSHGQGTAYASLAFQPCQPS